MSAEPMLDEIEAAARALDTARQAYGAAMMRAFVHVENERYEATRKVADMSHTIMLRDETIATLTRERDSYQRQLDAIGDAIVTSIVKRIEPRLSRHPVTVIMAAGALFFKIGEAIGCEFEDGDDLLEAVKELVRERDEARADAERYLADLRRCASEPYEHAKERAEAFSRGAEAMREACAQWIERECADERTAWHVARLPIPEEP